MRREREERQRRTPAWFLPVLVGGGAFLLLVCSGIAALIVALQSSGPPGTPGSPLLVRGEWEISRAYATNAAAADLKYTGKLVELTLTEAEVRKNDRGQYYVSGNDSVCRMRPGEQKRLAQHKPKQAIRLRGTCSGHLASRTHWRGFTVILEDCQIVAFLTWDGKDFK